MRLDPDSFITNEARIVEEQLKARSPKRRARWRGPALSLNDLLRLNDQRLHWRYECYSARDPLTGKEREICAPIDAIKWLSRGIYRQLSEPFQGDLPTCVQAYVGKRSHITNALAHADSREILEIDVQKAFPSVRQTVIAQALTRYMPGPEASFIAGLVCYRGRLTQGNPLSPLIFLIVTLKLTQRLAGLAAIYGLTFTIYADNIIFSGAHIPSGLAEEITTILHQEGFTAHPADDSEQRKHHLMGGSTCSRRIVTGLEITSSGLALPVEKQVNAKESLSHAISGDFLNKNDASIERRRKRDRVTSRLIYGASIDQGIKNLLREVLTVPATRQALKRNLGAHRTNQIMRQARKDRLIWEQNAEH